MNIQEARGFFNSIRESFFNISDTDLNEISSMSEELQKDIETTIKQREKHRRTTYLGNDGLYYKKNELSNYKDSELKDEYDVLKYINFDKLMKDINNK